MCSSLKGEAGIYINKLQQQCNHDVQVQARKGREGLTKEVISELNFEEPVTFFFRCKSIYKYALLVIQ